MNPMQEIAGLQAELMNVQAKYMSDPTPANMNKMQEEMAEITQKITELSMQQAAAYGGGFNNINIGGGVNIGGVSAGDYQAAAFAGMEAFANMANEMFGDNDEEKREFISQNPAPAEKQKYLPIGALLIVSHDEPWQTLALMEDNEYWEEILTEGWEIEDAEEGREMLGSLLEGRHNAVYGEDFKKFKAGQPNKLDDDSIENYNDTIECINEELPVLLPYAKSCDNIIAWDLERVCYLARMYHKLGWITEAEVWEWAEKTAAKIKQAYSCWEEYLVSILIGRAIAYDFDDEMIDAAGEILTDGEALLKANPISSL